MLVVDSSLLIALLFEEEHTAFAHRCLRGAAQTPLAAPGLLRWEIANVLCNKMRKGFVSPRDVAARLEGLASLAIEHPNREASSAALVDRALTWGLTAYDAAYLELALRSSAALATLDQAMAEAAVAAGLVVHSPFAP